MVALEARSLRQCRGRRDVIPGIDLTVGTGVTALLGPNGAGKTTLLETLATILRPKGGTLSIFGLDASRPRDRRQIRRGLGWMPQTPGFVPNFTVRESVAYAGWLKQVPPASLPADTEAIIEAVGLAERLDSPMKSLSGGMLRRVAVAQALVHKPGLILLDEPTVGLDPQQRIELRSLIRNLANDVAVLVSTHLVEDVRAAGDRVLLLRNGTVVFDGTPTALESAAHADAAGDNAMEKGYSAILAGDGE